MRSPFMSAPSFPAEAVHRARVDGVVGVTILVVEVMLVEERRVQHLHVPSCRTLQDVVGDASQLFFPPVDAGTKNRVRGRAIHLLPAALRPRILHRYVCSWPWRRARRTPAASCATGRPASHSPAAAVECWPPWSH